ncbi:MAG: universal stress protein [Flavobacteriaceae bacterium]
MKNVLIPTDFSENSWNAICYALNLFEKERCNFYMLHINSTKKTQSLLDIEGIDKGNFNATKKKLRNLLTRITAEFPEKKNHKFYTLTDTNFFITSIRKHVKEKKIDLIVMGTKGNSDLKESVIGSNTTNVIIKVPCNTLIIPEKSKFNSLKKIVFPTDFSLSYGIEALQPLSEILENNHADLHLLHISKKVVELNSSQLSNKELIEDCFSNQKHSFHFLINKETEEAVQEFTDSKAINMMVMMAKNLNYFQQILFHTKVEKIDYHTKIPLLVLHE